jgi:hypothetical protein
VAGGTYGGPVTKASSLGAALAPRQHLLIIASAATVAFAVSSAASATNSFAAARVPQGMCSYANGVVSAVGLPTGQVLNFLVNDNTTGIQTGWVLGISDNGTWQVDVTPPTSSTTYEFISKTWGPNGSKYTVYDECTAG